MNVAKAYVTHACVICTCVPKWGVNTADPVLQVRGGKEIPDGHVC